MSDLRLNQPVLIIPPHSFLNAVRGSCGDPVLSPASRTLEERRAYLGYFLLATRYVFYTVTHPTYGYSHGLVSPLYSVDLIHHDGQLTQKIVAST